MLHRQAMTATDPIPRGLITGQAPFVDCWGTGPPSDLRPIFEAFARRGPRDDRRIGAGRAVAVLPPGS